MSTSCVTVARGLVLHGRQRAGERLSRNWLLNEVDVKNGTFRSAAHLLGAEHKNSGCHFFDSSVEGQIAFGPGAGLAIGISLGTESLRASIVDANGWPYCEQELEPQPDQLSLPANAVLDRVKMAVESVIDEARKNRQLLVNDELRLLGCAVAWPSPVAKDKYPHGYALAHQSWRGGTPLHDRVRSRLKLGPIKSYAMNDAKAAAISVAWQATHSPGYAARTTPPEWKIPHLTLVLRIAGGIGGAVIVIQPPRETTDHERESGFLRSILIGGNDDFAGEIGHIPIHPEVVESLGAKLPRGLRKLEPDSCTCTPRDQPIPHHLEAFASGRSLASRINPRAPMHEVLERVLDEPAVAVHARGLQDIGALVGEALVGPVTLLNPTSVVLTGALAVAPVRDEIEQCLAAEHRFGRSPEVSALTGADNRFVRARGAALAMIRREVHRNFPEILVNGGLAAKQNVEALTFRV